MTQHAYAHIPNGLFNSLLEVGCATQQIPSKNRGNCLQVGNQSILYTQHTHVLHKVQISTSNDHGTQPLHVETVTTKGDVYLSWLHVAGRAPHTTCRSLANVNGNTKEVPLCTRTLLLMLSTLETAMQWVNTPAQHTHCSSQPVVTGKGVSWSHHLCISTRSISAKHNPQCTAMMAIWRDRRARQDARRYKHGQNSHTSGAYMLQLKYSTHMSRRKLPHCITSDGCTLHTSSR